VDRFREADAVMRRSLVILFLLAPAMARAQTKPSSPLRTYDTPFYTIHTDLGPDGAREAEVRMTRMAEEYRQRTRGFGGELRGRLPFFLFRTEADYHAAGGTRNTAGEYDPGAGRLMTFAGGERANLATWYTVQHEGFHQFADQVIGRGMPIAVNEGLAEYFGEALFTGDSFVTGVIPPWRLKRVRASFEAKKFMPLRELLSLPHNAWNERLSQDNYDQAWMLVHYMVHGEDGAHREPFAAFIRDTSTGRPWEAQWQPRFGDLDAFETKWRAWWTDLPDDPTADLYAEATLRTLTSFLARATARRQRFDSFEAFAASAETGELKSAESDWLPPSLIHDALKRAAAFQKDGARFAIVSDAPRPPSIVYTSKQGVQVVGRFTLKGSRVGGVSVER
jgi:hypothetical protein